MCDGERPCRFKGNSCCNYTPIIYSILRLLVEYVSVFAFSRVRCWLLCAMRHVPALLPALLLPLLLLLQSSQSMVAAPADCDAAAVSVDRRTCSARMSCRASTTMGAVHAMPDYAVAPSAALLSARKAAAAAAAEAESRTRSAGATAAAPFIAARDDANAAVLAALAMPDPPPRPALAATRSPARAALRAFRGGSDAMYAELLAAHTVVACAESSDAARSRWAAPNAPDAAWGTGNVSGIPDDAQVSARCRRAVLRGSTRNSPAIVQLTHCKHAACVRPIYPLLRSRRSCQSPAAA